MNDDPRINDAINLMQQAFSLLRQLQDLRTRMPEAIPDRRPVVSREERVKAYAVVIHTLEAQLQFALRHIAQDLDIRGQVEIRREILPPSAKGLTNEQYLKWLDDQMGPEPPTS
jgi:hypothetical protein